MKSNFKNALKGFTLVELSIVMVIIGLVISVVFVARELIQAGRVRSQIGQLNTYDAALANFVGKYQGYPGDFLHAQSLIDPGLLNGDGDGCIEDAVQQCANIYQARFSGEISQFWPHLSRAKLIPDLFDDSGVVGQSLPPFAINDSSGGFLVLGGVPFLSSGRHHFVFGYHNLMGGADLTPNLRQLSIIESFTLDHKMDDGVPGTGTVRAYGASGGCTTLSSSGLSGYDLDDDEKCTTAVDTMAW